MAPLRQHRVQFAGFDTRALELDGDGPPLLLLHGFADSADTWRGVLARLARAGRRALALDLPGFATAAPLRDGPILPQLDEFAADAASRLGPGTIIAGNSLGGCVALRAGENPRLDLAGVVPIAPAGLDMPGWFQIIERDPIVRTVLRSPLPVPERLMRMAVGEAYRQLAFARPRAAERAAVASFTRHHRDRRAVARYLENGRRLLPELADPFSLHDVGCPVLLVWGDRDRMVPHRGSRRVIDALPDTTYELFAETGHCPQVEEPDRLTGLLLEFAAAPRARVA